MGPQWALVQLPPLLQRGSVPTPQRHALSYPPGPLPDLPTWRQKASVSWAVNLAPGTNKKFIWEKEAVWKSQDPSTLPYIDYKNIIYPGNYNNSKLLKLQLQLPSHLPGGDTAGPRVAQGSTFQWVCARVEVSG